VALVDRNQVVEALPAGCPHPALRDRVRAGRPNRGLRTLDSQAGGALAEVGVPDPVTVMDEISRPAVPRCGFDYVPPYQEGEDSLFFETFNRNKKSISLDLASAAGRDVLIDLIRVSDAVYSNLRGDVPERLGIRYEDLKDINRRIVCCSLSGFGMTGPRRAEPAYDYILQGMCGWMSLTGEPDGPPAKSAFSLVDYSGGFVAALSLLAGVHAARRDGKGMDCDLSLFDVAISLLTYIGTWHLTRDFKPERMAHSAHPSLVPFQNFQTFDGWIVVACAKETFWGRLVQVLDMPELLEDPRFQDSASRHTNARPLLTIMSAAFKARPTDHWLERLELARIPCASINTVEQALIEPQVADRELIVETDHPRFGRVRQLASPVRVGPQTARHRRAPRRNEDGQHILRDLLGYSHAKIEELQAAAAFGPELS
jgi:crotonobetainyl-CoA:carnitine CoA-transferase CaiB-like acyl-CoA transferase